MSRTLKVISGVWLLVCVSVAIFGIFQSHGGNPEGGIAPTLVVTFLTTPLGIIVQVVYVGISNLLSGSSASIGLVGDVFINSAMIGVGYWQWFILLPKIVKRARRDQSPKIWGAVIVGLMAILYGLYRFYLHVFPSTHLN